MPEFDADRLLGPYGEAHVWAALLWPATAAEAERVAFEDAVVAAALTQAASLGLLRDEVLDWSWLASPPTMADELVADPLLQAIVANAATRALAWAKADRLRAADLVRVGRARRLDDLLPARELS